MAKNIKQPVRKAVPGMITKEVLMDNFNHSLESEDNRAAASVKLRSQFSLATLPVGWSKYPFLLSSSVDV